MSKSKKVLIIGGGLGGISAAISLATEGFEVELFEKNDKIGGKLNFMNKEGFCFDLGPSIIILPQFFRRLFKKTGKKMEDYFEFVELQPQWRSFFEDGTFVDLYSDIKLMENELKKLGKDSAGYWEFIEYSRKLYNFAEEVYFERGSDSIYELAKGYSVREVIKKIDMFSTMEDGVSRFIKNKYLHDMLSFFIKYVGSSSYDAPAILNLLPFSQLGYGLWYVKGGMYNLARGYEKRMNELGVKIHLNSEVVQMVKNGDNIEGIILKDGSRVNGDIIVSNMEVIPAYKRLLNEKGVFIKRYEYFYEPAASGIVIHLGVNKIYPQLNHHNFFFSNDLKKHFDTIHHKKKLPEDPTIYLVCPTKTDPELAPAGHDIIKILPHIPYIQEKPFTRKQYIELKERVLDKLERMGLDNLRKHIVVEDMLVPEDIEKMYYSNKGAIYGVVSNQKKNLAWKAPKKSIKYKNLYFVGGSVNPGAGTCMVVLSGQKVKDLILRDFS